MTAKSCTRCGKEKPATTDYFCRRAANKDGLAPECRECLRERNKVKHQRRHGGGDDRTA
jgi:hypothetical protein